MKETRCRGASAAVSCAVLVALTGCGGGGGSAAPTGSSTDSTPAAALSPNNTSEQVFFTDSYEFIGANGYPVRGYVHNAATSNGDLGRTAYASTSGSYAPIVTLYSFQTGYLGSSGTQLILDPWVLPPWASGHVRNDTSGSYLLKFSAVDWFTIKGIQEVDVSGKPFDAYLPTHALDGVSGVFPAGSKAYTAVWQSKQDIYLASGTGSVFSRPASDHYFLDYYNTSSHAYCLSETRGLVFDSLTHATSYPLIVRNGTACLVDTTTGAASHDVSSHQAGGIWFFDLTDGQTQSTDFFGDFFGALGVSSQTVALVLEEASASQVVEHLDGYVYRAGSQGSYLATSGVRMNKVALNALLVASSLPALP